MSTAFICTACGTQYAPSETPPAQCAICEEERQYVPAAGQSWTTLPALAAKSFNTYRQHEPGLLGIGTQPAFAIGQRALLVCTPHGNVLWDCIAMLDAATVYGHYFDRVIPRDGKRVVRLSVERYLAAIAGKYAPRG